ncbi:hypothetical protein IW262DRAFT_1299783 [Armillaria fumosa]|nr:hypothetical protein IW262DRAFT_1299783 [Armillaria fumosa]
MLETRRLNKNQTEIPTEVHIAKDGKAVRILRAFVGNNVDMGAPWLQIMDHLHDKFNDWEATHPMIEGRRILIQMYAGGLMQFLTHVQGMPDTMTKQIEKLIKDFTWDNQGKAPVNKMILATPR